MLDGLRGVASLSVGVLHVNGLILHYGFDCMTYLAVDFFFCLSGFVLSHAYGTRLAEGTLRRGAFFALRLRRLYPMILAGALLGIVTALALAPFSLGETLTLGLATVLLLPAGFAFGDIAFPLNNVFWSLLFELGAGVTFASLAASRNRVWALIAGVSAVILLMAAWKGADAGKLGFADPVMFVLGLPRMLLPFALGILVERKFSGRQAPSEPVSPWLSILLLVAVLFSIPSSLPFAATLSTIVAMPMIVWFGANASAGRLSSTMRHLGAVSYPFYAVHLPLVLIGEAIANRLGLGTGAGRLALAAAALTGGWLLAIWLGKRWEGPARAWLSRRAAGEQAVALGA